MIHRAINWRKRRLDRCVVAVANAISAPRQRYMADWQLAFAVLIQVNRWRVKRAKLKFWDRSRSAADAETTNSFRFCHPSGSDVLGVRAIFRNTYGAFSPPNERDIPHGAIGDSIRYGEKVLTQTQVNAKAYVGNGLNCTSCHLNGGKTYASPWVGIWGGLPEYRSRNAKVNALQDRINDCFQRSMNGKPLPMDSEEMRGILSYMWWLSKDLPTGIDVEGRGLKRIKLPAAAQIDPARGKQLFAEKCAACHGAEGQGLNGSNGEYLFPALWGPQSFNIGAGMARLGNAAAFTKANMLLGSGNSLSDQEDVDIAAYFTRQPRPDYAAKTLD